MTGQPQAMVRPSAGGGSGWQANLIESLMAEYRFTLRQAIWGISVTAAFALTSARADRLGVDRPGYTDTAAGEARAKAKAWFSENFQII